MTTFNEALARELAKMERYYSAYEKADHTWIVWDAVSDHRVDFDRAVVEATAIALGIQQG
jgi:hypothetical protein